ncbi:MAG: hypothetical protein JNK48_21645 [Bryobacterales bacterium]|nr:hypothetical protein [Bryobacterales bacterium]
MAGLWVGLVLFASGLTGATRCRDIASADLRNAVLEAARDSGGHDYGLWNGPAPGGALRMRDGVAWQWDGGPWGKHVRQGRPPDWKTSIEQDVLLAESASSGTRLLVLEQVQLTGSNAYTYILGFQCVAGAVKKVFEASGQGVRLERVRRDGMDIKVGIWGEKDAHCCPGREALVKYSWRPARGGFVRESSNALCWWLP